MIARRHGYLRVLSPTANSLYVRIARRQGYLRVPILPANSLHVRISRRQGGLRYLAQLAIARMSRLLVTEGYLAQLFAAYISGLRVAMVSQPLDCIEK